MLDTDIARVLKKLTINCKDTKSIHYPKERKQTKLFFLPRPFIVFFCRKTFEIKGFKALINRIVESKGVSHNDILTRIHSNECPRLNHVTETTNKEITGRMTDTTHYT